MSRLVPHPPATHVAPMVGKRRQWHARKKAGERSRRNPHRRKRTGRQYPVGVWTRPSACPDPTVVTYPSTLEQPQGRLLGSTCPCPKEAEHLKSTDGVEGHANPRAQHPLKDSVKRVAERPARRPRQTVQPTSRMELEELTRRVRPGPVSHTSPQVVWICRGIIPLSRAFHLSHFSVLRA